MSKVENTAVLGAGVIGASWTALFLAAGCRVDVFDLAENAEKSVRDYVERAWPTLTELGLAENGDPDNIRFFSDAASAAKEAEFIQ